MNQKDLIWHIAMHKSDNIKFDPSFPKLGQAMEAISIEMTREQLNSFVAELFEMFREELSLKKYEDSENCQYQDGYNQALADCMAETLVFTGEVE